MINKRSLDGFMTQQLLDVKQARAQTYMMRSKAMAQTVKVKFLGNTFTLQGLKQGPAHGCFAKLTALFEPIKQPGFKKFLYRKRISFTLMCMVLRLCFLTSRS